MAMSLSLATYDVTPDRGFLCGFDAAAVTLPAELAPIEAAGRSLPDWIMSARLRSLIERLPRLDLGGFLATASDAAARLAMVRYSFLTQAYVWGAPDAPERLPACLAVPIVQLADHLGLQPLLPYSSYVLDNWSTFDPDGPIDLDNIYMIQNFAGGMDENWFVMVHVAIEARAGAALALIPPLIDAAKAGDAKRAHALLADMAPVWNDLNAIFDRMPEKCDPYVYFNRVRPYIHGWKDNPALAQGLIYDGVAKFKGEPQAFRGQTGSQSSIVPTMDALLGVSHAEDPLRAFLDELHFYRPTRHRRLIEDVRAASHLRHLGETAGDPALKDAYNAILTSVARFRTRHLEYAASYINKQSAHATGNDTDVGTGGTPFMRYLKKHRDASEAHLLR